MKKIALFVSVLLLASALFADAPVFEAKPGLSGYATLTFGVALDSPLATGFSNESKANVTLGLINEATDAKGGKEGEEVYGWIELKNFKIALDNGDQKADASTDSHVKIETPEISAKLFLGPVYINILGTDKAADKAGNIQESTLTKTTTAVAQNPADEFEGFSIGLKDTSVVDLTVGVSTKFDWLGTNTAATAQSISSTYKWVTAGTYTLAANEVYTGVTTTTGGVTYSEVQVVTVTPATAASTTGHNATNVYNFYVAAALKAVPDLIAEVAANMTTDTGNTIGAGVKAGYGIAVAEGIKITPTVGFDMAYSTALSYQLTGDVFVSFPGDKKKFTMQKAEIEYSPGFEVKFTMDNAASSNMDLGVYVLDGTLIPVLDLFAAFEITSLGKASQLMGLGLNVAATIDVLSPFATFKYASAISPAKPTTNLEVGVDIKAITNTTFTLKYASGNLSAATVGLGTITFATKIAY
jgi:hypothetical protein